MRILVVTDLHDREKTLAPFARTMDRLKPDAVFCLGDLTEHVRTIAYSECDENTAVLLYAVEGGGHTGPGSIDVPRLGAVTNEIDATDLLWEFFEAQAP